jgi:hypothetical protein
MTFRKLFRALPITLVLLAVVAMAPTAHAAITATSVTAPAHGSTYVMDESPGAGPHEVTFSGTSDASDPADTVDLRCYARQGSGFSIMESIASGIATDDATGAWSTTVDVSSLSGTCLVRAVPAGTPNPAPTLLAFAGPTVHLTRQEVQRVAGGINAGKIHQWEVRFGRALARASFGSALNAGLGIIRAYTGATIHQTPVAHANAMVLEGGTGELVDSLSGLMVDGAYAWHPDSAADAGSFGPFNGDDLVGFAGIELDITAEDPATGAPGAVEAFDIVRCNAGQHLQAPGATCTQFVATGVRLTRRFSFPDGARTARITDTWSSTDGAAHVVTAQYNGDLVNLEATEPLALSWLNGGSYAPRPAGDVTPPPAGPWSMRGNPNAEAADGDLDVGRYARVTSSAPDALRFAGGAWEYLERHQVSIPAGGSATIDTALIAGVTQSEVDARVTHYTDLFVAPALTVLAPTDGVTSDAATIPVTGIATDNVTVAGVTVNGAAAVVAPGGAFTANVPLAVGANTIAIVATDGAGNTTTARRTVTYAPPPPPPPPTPQTRFIGTSRADTLRGNGLANVLEGLGGNDRLFCGIGGRDRASGGTGNDRVDCVEPYASARANRDVVDCGAGTRDVAFVDPFDVVRKNCEKVTRTWNGGARADRWRGTKANDRFSTLGGNDNVSCGGGVDSASLGAGNDTVNCWDAGKAAAKKKSKDVVNCGAGKKDVAIVDRYDVVRFCEKVIRRT